MNGCLDHKQEPQKHHQILKGHLNNKQNYNTLNVRDHWTRHNKIPPLHITDNRFSKQLEVSLETSPQTKRLISHENQKPSRDKATKRFLNQSFESHCLDEENNRYYEIIGFLKQVERGDLMRIMEVMWEIPCCADRQEKVREIDLIIEIEVEKKMNDYEQKLLEIVSYAEQLKQTIMEMEEQPSISNSKMISTTPQSHNTKLKDQIDNFLSSIHRRSNINEFTTEEQMSLFSHSMIRHIHEIRQRPSSASGCSAWEEIFREFKWAFKFILEFMAVRGLYEDSMEVYQWYRSLKVGLNDQQESNCDAVLKFIKQCNCKLQQIKEKKHNNVIRN